MSRDELWAAALNEVGIRTWAIPGGVNACCGDDQDPEWFTEMVWRANQVAASAAEGDE